jgi:TonB family protein
MLILVVESESRHAERAKDGLGSDGWSIEVVSSAAAAAAAAGSLAPQLILVNAEMPGAVELLRRFSRAQGGPGTIAMLPEMPSADAAAAARAADETLSKPFQDVALRQLARRMTSAEAAPKVTDDGSTKRLTSHELFGDLLAEVESEIEGVAAPAKPTPAPPAAAPTPAAASPTLTKLEQTLSGVLKDERAKVPGAASPAGRKSDNIDDLLSRTLSGLDVAKKAAKPAATVPPAAAPARPAAAAPAPPAPAKPEPPRVEAPQPTPVPVVPPAHVPPPASAPAPAPMAPVAPVAPMAPMASTPAVDRVPPSAPTAPPPVVATPAPSRPASDTTPARRASREIDLNQLDALAKPRPRESAPASRPGAPAAKAPDGFATQKVPVTPSFLQPQSNEFGQYTLLERIAIGGMAEVWKARMKGVEGFQKTVAIKKILPHLTDSSDFVTMFIDEAKLAAQLNHNNIIHIYDLGKINDDYFIAMEYVDGKDLRAILNQARAESKPLPMGLALFVGSRLASALDHAHRQKDFEGRSLGLVHRDVSPQNVLISYEGDIKLCDFGIVKAVTKASKTQMGALKGKLQYMSPEQAWGRPVDARSDLFSLGSLLFEMLTGRRLFSGESEMSVLDAVREGRIQAPRDLDPRLPLEINALVLKALSRDPDDRFQNASEMQREIDSILGSLKPTPTQSELGGYLQRLFESERQGEAPLAAAALDAPAVSGAIAAAGASGAASAAVPKKAEVPVVAPTGVSRIEEAESGKGRNLLWLAIGGAAAAGLVAYLVLGRPKQSPAPPPEPPAATESAQPGAVPPADGSAPAATEATPAAAIPAAPAGAAAVDQMVDAEVKRREEELKKKYEDELAKRRAEIEKLNQPAAAPAAATPVKTPPPVAAAPEPEPAPAPVEAAPEPEPQPAPAAPVEAPVEASAPAPPSAPLVKEGDLVQPGAGVKPPVLASFTKPEYPPIARRLKVEGMVVLSLLVDETGRVIDTRLESGVAQNVGINEASLAAARNARFNPATKNGVRVKMWYQLKIPFKL